MQLRRSYPDEPTHQSYPDGGAACNPWPDCFWLQLCHSADKYIHTYIRMMFVLCLHMVRSWFGARGRWCCSPSPSDPPPRSNSAASSGSSSSPGGATALLRAQPEAPLAHCMAQRHPELWTIRLVEHPASAVPVPRVVPRRPAHQEPLRYDLPRPIPSVDLVRGLCPGPARVHALRASDRHDDGGIKPLRPRVPLELQQGLGRC